MGAFQDVIHNGSRRDSLEALRDLIAATLQVAEPKEVAALSRQLTDILRQLDSIPLGKEASTLDDLAAKRAKRRSGGRTAARS